MNEETTELLNGQLTVSRETLERLKRFQSLFEIWSKRINLVAASTTNDVWQRHVEDSAQLLLLKPNMRSVADIGSGGGFPGIILAIMLDDCPNCAVSLIESNRKKTAFLQTVRAQCAKRAKIHSERIELALPQISRPDFITARALASLNKLFVFTECHLSQGSVGLFHKGRDYEREIEESRANWEFDLITHKSRIEAESVILEISNLRARL